MMRKEGGEGGGGAHRRGWGGGIGDGLQVKHAHLLGLPDAVGPGNGLLLVLGVGIRIIYYHLRAGWLNPCHPPNEVGAS